MKLIAKVNVKHGKDGRTAAPGDLFDVDTAMAELLIASRSAATPEDYEREVRANKSAEERIAELEAEKADLEAQLAKTQADLAAATAAAGKK